MALDVIADETWDDVDKAWDSFTLETWDGWIEFSYALKIYDTSAVKVAEITGDLKNPTLTNLEFETLQQGGCGAFSFTLAKPYTQAMLDYDYKVEIYIFNPVQVLFYTGKIINKPIEGTEKPQTYSGWGYFNELEKKNIKTQVSPGNDITTDVDSLLVDFIVDNTSILKDSSLLEATGYPRVSTFDVHNEFAKDVFNRLKELAGGYKYGVNADRKFYFQLIDTSVNYYWHVGKHLTEFHPEEDPSELVKKVIATYPEEFMDGYELEVTSEAGDYSGLYEKPFSVPQFVNVFSSTNIASEITPSTNPAGTGAADLCDGDNSSLWESGANQASGHYIEVDLGADYENISMVTIDSIHSTAKDYSAKSIRIQIKPDGGSYSTMISSDGAIQWKDSITFRPTTGRYVKISLTQASSEEWKVGEIEIYQLNLADMQRWADGQLAKYENVKKRATARIDNIQSMIMDSAGLVPIKPEGKASIFDRNGTKIDDYQVIACKYRLSSGGFSLDLELGDEKKSVADKDKEWERRIRELENSGVRRAANLSLSKGFQLSKIKGTYIGENEIQTKHFAAHSVLAGEIAVVGIDANGQLVLSQVGSGNFDNIPEGTTYQKVKETALTDGEVDLSQAGVISKTAANIAETAGLKWAAEHGANITESRTSLDTTNVDGTAAATVKSNAADGKTSFDGTVNYRSTGAPTNNPAPTAITKTTKANGTMDIKLEWGQYTQGADKADNLMFFWKKGAAALGAPTVNDSCIIFNVNTAAASYFILEGVNPADNWSFGIAAARRTENALEIGAIQSPTDAPDWQDVTEGTANFTANINAKAATTIIYHNGTKFVKTSDAAVDADDLDESATKKWAGETGADITGSHEADVALANLGEKNVDSLADTGNYVRLPVANGADSVSETAAKKWAAETGANITGGHTSLDTTNVDGTAAATVKGNAADGKTGFDNTVKYRTTGAPTNNPTPTTVAKLVRANGSMDIKLGWDTYTQGANQADLILLFWEKSTEAADKIWDEIEETWDELDETWDGTSLGAPTVNDHCIAFNVNTAAASYFFLEGCNPNSCWSFGIAAARRTENGLEVGAIQSSEADPDWQDVTGEAPNFEGNIHSEPAVNIQEWADNPAARINDKITLIEPGKILIHGGTNLDDWRATADYTLINGGKVYVSDLAEIKNLLTVASRKIIIGANGIGAGLDGILINDGTYDRVAMGEVEADTYGVTVKDSSGVTWTSLGELQRVWQKVYDAYVTDSDATEIDITGLDGDTDQVYYIVWTVLAGAATQPGFRMQINEDTGNNYGRTHIGTDGTDPICDQVTGVNHWPFIDTDANGQTGQAYAIIDAKTGKKRTCNVITGCRIPAGSTTTVGRTWRYDQVWNNTADNITSLLFYSSVNAGIAVGSHLLIYKMPLYA